MGKRGVQICFFLVKGTDKYSEYCFKNAFFKITSYPWRSLMDSSEEVGGGGVEDLGVESVDL